MASRCKVIKRNVYCYLRFKLQQGFYDYYQVVHLSDETNDESELGSKSGELKGYTAGLHSPWGVIGQIAKDRNLTKHKVLWGDSWLNFQLYAADSPRYVRGQRPVPVVESLEELRRLRGIE